MSSSKRHERQWEVDRRLAETFATELGSEPGRKARERRMRDERERARRQQERHEEEEDGDNWFRHRRREGDRGRGQREDKLSKRRGGVKSLLERIERGESSGWRERAARNGGGNRPKYSGGY